MWRQHARLQQQEQRRQESNSRWSNSSNDRQGWGTQGRGRGRGQGRGWSNFPDSRRGPPPHQTLPPKPWVDRNLEMQMHLRNSLQAAATTSRLTADFESYRQQRAKVNRLERDLMTVYFRNHPSEEEFWLPQLAVEASQTMHSCDVCELTFENETQLVTHEESHQICDIEGCTHMACPEQLEEHILLMHISGLYHRMKTGSSKEEVQKWKDERKSKFPTLKAVEKKQEREKELQRRRQMQRRRFAEERRELAEQSRVIQEAVSESLYHSKRKRMHARAARAEESEPVKKVTKRREEFSDESDAEGFCDGLRMFRGLLSLPVESEALGASSEDAVDASEAAKEDETGGSGTAEQSDDDDDDDDMPEEVAIGREAPGPVGLPPEIPPSATRIESGSNGTERDYVYERMQKMRMLRVLAEKKLVRTSFRVNSRRSVPPTLLEKLLAKEIETEHSELLQCVKYVVENNFFGVGQSK